MTYSLSLLLTFVPSGFTMNPCVSTCLNGGRPVANLAVPASGPVVARFENLPAGDYAVKSFHDLNGDGEMTTNPFGMPTEPYAFSNNAVGNMGPARWDRAHFRVSGETAQTISIR